MPELPEVETTVNGIRPFLEGEVIDRIVARETQLRWPISPDLLTFAAGQTVRALRRRGKYIVIEFAHGGLLIHLGMSGSVRVLPHPISAIRHEHFDIITARGRVIRYRDPRKFGCLLHTPTAIDDHPRLRTLGVEPLTAAFDAAWLSRGARARRIAVKMFIMDAKVVVGVGNIYASEALFRAGIHPQCNCANITSVRYGRLVTAIQQVLQQAIAEGGTTLQDFVNSVGEPGYFARALKVYGRAGEPCLHCGSVIKKVVLGQRSTFYCGRCQR